MGKQNPTGGYEEKVCECRVLKCGNLSEIKWLNSAQIVDFFDKM